jgi:hypothetical protein
MDIDVYHAAGWTFAVAITVYGLRSSRSKPTIPMFLTADTLLAVSAGQQGGFAVIKPRWHDTRSLCGFLIAALGIALCGLAFHADSKTPSNRNASK